MLVIPYSGVWQNCHSWSVFNSAVMNVFSMITITTAICVSSGELRQIHHWVGYFSNDLNSGPTYLEDSRQHKVSKSLWFANFWLYINKIDIYMSGYSSSHSWCENIYDSSKNISHLPAFLKWTFFNSLPISFSMIQQFKYWALNKFRSWSASVLNSLALCLSVCLYISLTSSFNLSSSSFHLYFTKTTATCTNTTSTHSHKHLPTLSNMYTQNTLSDQ